MKKMNLISSQNVIKFFAVLIMILVFAGIFLGPYSVSFFFFKGMFSILGNYWQLFLWGTVFIAFFVFVFRREIFELNDIKACILIFSFSFILRTIFAFLYSPEPVSDFEFYYNAGEWFIQRDYSRIADRIAQYQIPSFGGLVVLNTFLTCLFSHTLIGQQIANSVMTSLSCVCIFGIGKKIDRKIGIIAAVIYSLYPSNIIMTQVCTNQHGASLMYLCATLCVFQIKRYEEITKRAAWAVLTGICTATGYFFHPSAIIIVLTFLCWSFVYVIHSDKNGVKKHIIDFSIFLVTYVVIIKLSILLLLGNGIISSTKSPAVLPRLVIALNYETMGQWSADDLQALSNADDPDQLAKELIEERIKDPKKLCRLYWNKLNILMFGQDSSFMWYKYGEETAFLNTDVEDSLYLEKQEHYSQIKEFTESIARWDQYFVFMLYLLAFLGLGFCLYHKSNSLVLLYLLIETCGWISVFVLAEIQPRYRYYIMPEIVICTAYGINNLFQIIGVYKEKFNYTFLAKNHGEE